MIGRLGYALHQRRRPRTAAAWLRLAWHDFITHALLNRGGERCQDCGRGYPLWRAGNDLYVEVVGNDGGLFCPSCFGRRAEAQGIVVQYRAWIFSRKASE